MQLYKNNYIYNYIFERMCISVQIYLDGVVDMNINTVTYTMTLL